MRNKLLFTLVGIGLVAGFGSAMVYAVPTKPPPPVFNPTSNPYAEGIFANGIVESYQSQGENINLYPEVSGTVVAVFVTEGQRVARGAPLEEIDDSIQRAIVEQQKSQADASLALLEELKAQPRRENLDVARAQVDAAEATLKNTRDQLTKIKTSYELAPGSVSKDAYDNAVNAARIAEANLGVVTRQYELTKAGAWVFDIRNQEKQHEAQVKAYGASKALLAKYTIRAPVDGIVLSTKATTGSYVSPQGVYDTYTQGLGPAVVMATAEGPLAVRCYVDEILIPRLPPMDRLRAQMTIRGTNTKIPLHFDRLQPYVTPKIQLSDQRQERVDLRVLPVIFRFEPAPGVSVYPGQLVDVYIGGT